MNWIDKSAKRGKTLRKQYKLRDIEIFIKDSLPKEIDPDFVFKYIASVLPEHLLTNVDIVYIGQFDNLISRDIRGVFEDGAIYVTNEQDTEMDLIDDLIHEISHSIEKEHQEIIYGDARLLEEFRKKRAQLYEILKDKGMNPPASMLNTMDYDSDLDDYFYKEVTYPILNQIVSLSNLFIGAYSVTSIREYFATGFEGYFLHEKQLVFDFCPILYGKLKALDELEV